MNNTNNANDILERLRALGACGDAARPEPTEEGPTGWVVKALETHSPGEVWRHAVDNHIADAWWLAEQLGMARPALTDVVRRALTYAAEAAEAAGLGGTELRRVATAEVLDHEAAEYAADDAARAAEADAAADAARAAAWASDAAADAAWPAARVADAAEAAAEAAEAAQAEAEHDQQREQLLGLWSEIYAALKGVT